MTFNEDFSFQEGAFEAFKEEMLQVIVSQCSWLLAVAVIHIYFSPLYL